MNTHSIPLLKYPRTAHLAGSRLQQDDNASDQIALSSLAGRYVVIEEKLDGANTGVSFSDAADLLLQSRGHYLVGGGSERQFNLLKPWAAAHEAWLLGRLEDLFVMYGEWTYAKHSVFYDKLPHFFHEFDLYDRRAGHFLSTRRRHALLAGGPVLSVPVLYAGLMPTNPKHLWKLVVRSLAKTRHWKASFEATVAREGQPLALSWQQTDKSDRSEGLYLKVEDDEKVLARYKLVRSDFTQTILDSGSHYARRPILPNGLADGVDIYAPQVLVNWNSLGLKTLRTVDEISAASPAWLDDQRA